MASYLVVFFGAGIGGTLRHVVNIMFLRIFGAGVPIGTPVINVSGSFAMGIVGGYFLLRSEANPLWRLFLTTGVLGGFTTFSTFSLEAALLYERGELGQLALYVAASVGLGVLGLFAGLALIRQFGPA